MSPGAVQHQRPARDLTGLRSRRPGAGRTRAVCAPEAKGGCRPEDAPPAAIQSVVSWFLAFPSRGRMEARLGGLEKGAVAGGE